MDEKEPVERLSQEAREWAQVMQSLTSTTSSVSYDDLREIGLSDLDDALYELEGAGWIEYWGDSYATYVEMLWDEIDLYP